MSTAATSSPASAGKLATAPLLPSGEVDWVTLYLGFGAMVVGQFMATLDIQIVASSLRQIQAGVSASADEIAWIQTAYLIPEVVMIPLAGYLARYLGTQKVFMVSCAGFTVMSVLAGLSSSIEMMIVTRALQGFLGGAMIPTVFAIAFTAFPPERRITAGTLIGLMVTLATTIGPTLGGHLTDILGWRWLFFINVIPGLAVLVLVGRYGNFDRGDPALGKSFDWFGLGAMAAFLMSLQYVLQEGTKKNWFDDDRILWLSVLASLSSVVFVWRQLTYRQPIVQLSAFADRNFSVGILINFASGATVFGGTFLIPLFLGEVQQYSAAQVGTTMLVSGATSLAVSPIAAQVVRRYDPRIAMVFGLVLAAAAVWTGHAINRNWGFGEFALLQALRAFGVLIAMIGSQMLAMSTLTPELVMSASGIINLARNTGGAVGIAVLSTTITQKTAEHLNELSAGVSLSNAHAQGMMAVFAHRMEAMGVSDADGAAHRAFRMLLTQNAQVLAFGDGFALMALGCLAAAAVALLARPPPVALMGFAPAPRKEK